MQRGLGIIQLIDRMANLSDSFRQAFGRPGFERFTDRIKLKLLFFYCLSLRINVCLDRFKIGFSQCLGVNYVLLLLNVAETVFLRHTGAKRYECEAKRGNGKRGQSYSRQPAFYSAEPAA
ncbi:hypothetical protein LD112_20640 [Pantoea agglomerans]|nr:hypothetical protein [Pantoea agglomerans]